jgi:hypothetical protein
MSILKDIAELLEAASTAELAGAESPDDSATLFFTESATAAELEDPTSPAVSAEELETAGFSGVANVGEESSPQASNPKVAVKVMPKAIFLKFM